MRHPIKEFPQDPKDITKHSKDLIKHFILKVIGKVQGVFFREETQKLAESLGLVGFVRNDPDKSVCIEVEGEEVNLHKLIDWVKSGGPEMARVDEVKIKEIKVTQETSSAQKDSSNSFVAFSII